ncbi:MAG: LEA type 2 family protein [Gammaproteobacteria bacterium]|nr:LEA type 2 family protein [Gammaproteobacteria bacterium]
MHSSSSLPASLRALAVMMAMLALSSCALLRPDLSPPQATLVAVELTELGVRSQRFRLVFDLDNPNNVALPVSELGYRVVLAGNEFAQGRSEGAFRVPARGRERVRLSVSTDLLRSLDQLQGLIGAGSREVDYEFEGRVFLDMPMRPSLRFADSGSIALDF